MAGYAQSGSIRVSAALGLNDWSWHCVIIHERKALFVHVPKTAGVSITHAVLSSVLGIRTTGQIKRLPVHNCIAAVRLATKT